MEHLSSPLDRHAALALLSSVLWAEGRLAPSAVPFFVRAAGRLGLDARAAARATGALLAAPPPPDAVDPARVSRAVARVVRQLALPAARAATSGPASLLAHEHARALLAILPSATSGVARCA